MATKAKKAPAKAAPKKAAAKASTAKKKAPALVERIVRREDTKNNVLNAYKDLQTFYAALDKKGASATPAFVKANVARIVRHFENEIQRYDATLDRILSLIGKQLGRDL